VLQRLSDEIIDRVAENAAQRLIGPEPPQVWGEVCDTDCRVLERGPEPRLAVGESAPGLDFLVYHFAEQQRAADPAVDGAQRLHEPSPPVGAPSLTKERTLLASQFLAGQHASMNLPPARRNVGEYLVMRTAGEFRGSRQPEIRNEPARDSHIAH